MFYWVLISPQGKFPRRLGAGKNFKMGGWGVALGISAQQATCGKEPIFIKTLSRDFEENLSKSHESIGNLEEKINNLGNLILN